ncbi:ABC transporter substrate-binding protein [Bradyrhizobium sp. dw_78]|uniref:ABC transporter substrate-binding protein n=1 Tax=Bradyrhizobium sp. dw_78 TaxID=2719793 RepID=UPI00201BF3B0|nr:ABC transporter substrate-binding protein [Bradyrhizobium sp. dw_78]
MIKMHRLGPIAVGLLLSLQAAPPAMAEIPGKLLKIGVLTDMSGPFSEQAGKGSVVAAELAAEDFRKEAGDLKVEIVSADHQNKVDVGTALARSWLDRDGVTAVVDLPNSGVALSISSLLNEKNRVTLASTAATSELTGKECKPTTVQWDWDTWALGNAMARVVTAAGGKRWFFISFDYALGRSLEKDTTDALGPLGGTVLGGVKHPLNTMDFSSYILQAQSSGADVIALGDTGTDAVSAIKQMGEFGILTGKTRLAALFLLLTDVQAIGPQQAQGTLLAEPFYWDLNDKTRAFSKRFGERMNGQMPTTDHAGVYSATLAYLRAAKAADTIEGDKVVAEMRKSTIDDDLFGPTKIRIDGRAVHSMYVFQVKTPAESKNKYDLYKLVREIPAEQAFRPLNAGGCNLVPPT